MSVLMISIFVIENSEEAILVNIKELKQIICIQYLIAFPGGIN